MSMVYSSDCPNCLTRLRLRYVKKYPLRPKVSECTFCKVELYISISESDNYMVLSERAVHKGEDIFLKLIEV